MNLTDTQRKERLTLGFEKAEALGNPTNSKKRGTVMKLTSLRLYSWRPINNALMKILASVVVAVVFSCVSRYGLADQGAIALQSAERWEDIAKIRLQTAKDHEIQAENAFKWNGANSFDTGDLLDFAGDEKFLASEGYQMAGQQWEKAARAYQSAGDSIKAKKARENVSRSLEAAKRALDEGVDLHMKAIGYYEASNNLDKKIKALEKAARNLERLMEMK